MFGKFKSSYLIDQRLKTSRKVIFHLSTVYLAAIGQERISKMRQQKHDHDDIPKAKFEVAGPWQQSTRYTSSFSTCDEASMI